MTWYVNFVLKVIKIRNVWVPLPASQVSDWNKISSSQYPNLRTRKSNLQHHSIHLRAEQRKKSNLLKCIINQRFSSNIPNITNKTFSLKCRSLNYGCDKQLANKRHEKTTWRKFLSIYFLIFSEYPRNFLIFFLLSPKKPRQFENPAKARIPNGKKWYCNQPVKVFNFLFLHKCGFEQLFSMCTVGENRNKIMNLRNIFWSQYFLFHILK